MYSWEEHRETNKFYGNSAQFRAGSLLLTRIVVVWSLLLVAY